MSGIANGLLLAYFYIVAASVLLKVVGADPQHPVPAFVRALTEPAYQRVRKAMPFVVLEGLDLSPGVVVAGILLARELLNFSLQHI